MNTTATNRKVIEISVKTAQRCYCHGSEHCFGNNVSCQCDNWQQHLETNCGLWPHGLAIELLMEWRPRDARHNFAAVTRYKRDALIRLLRYDGDSERSIAQTLGVSRDTVRAALNKHRGGRFFTAYDANAGRVIGLWSGAALTWERLQAQGDDVRPFDGVEPLPMDVGAEFGHDYRAFIKAAGDTREALDNVTRQTDRYNAIRIGW